MMSWIDECECDVLKAFARHTAVCVLISKVDGTIVWANTAFCEWSRYTLSELQTIGWKKLSADDESLQADIEAAKSLDVYCLSYTVEKQYIPKNDKPQWGILNVLRYPATGEMKYCCCTWEPLKNGTATAFAYAMEHSKSTINELEKLSLEVSKLTSQTDEVKWVMSTVSLAKTYPKLFATVIVITFSIFGMNNVVELLGRFGIIEIPVKVIGVPEQSQGSIETPSTSYYVSRNILD